MFTKRFILLSRILVVAGCTLAVITGCRSTAPVTENKPSDTVVKDQENLTLSTPVPTGLLKANTAITPMAIPSPAPEVKAEEMPAPAPAGPEKRLVYSNIPNFVPDDLSGVPADLTEIKRLVSEIKTSMDERTIVIEKPVEVIVEKEIEKIVEVPVEKTVEVEVEKIVEKEVIVEKPVEVIVEKVVEKIVEVPVEVIVEKEVEKIVEVPVEVIVEKEIEVIVEEKLDTPQLLERMDVAVGGDIANQAGGLKPFIAKASLPLFGRNTSLSSEELARLSDEDRALVESYQTLFANLNRQLGSSTPESDRAALVESSAQLTESINARKSIEISQAWLCRGVTGFGSFVPFEVYDFRRTDMPNILVYSELDNYKSTRREDGQYVVNLTQELSLVKEGRSGKESIVWSEQPVQIADLSRNVRRDFFLVQYLRLPEKIDTGDYALVITVTDNASGTITSKKIPLRILK